MSTSAEKLAAVARRLRFGVFEVDLDGRELRRSGLRVKLQRKPFQILELLLRAPGQLVTREEMAQRLWPDLHVAFDRSLNTAVNALRLALGDSPRHPRFIETRPGFGYRFLAPVEVAVEHTVARAKLRAVDSGARQDYLRGRYFYHKLTEEDLHKSVACFQSALAQDPHCALAHAGLADTYGLFAFLNLAPAAELYTRAKNAALRALSIDSGLGEAHAALAGVKRLFEWDWAGAEAEYRIALHLAPDAADVRQAHGAFLAALGRSEEAAAEFRHAAQDDSPSPAAGARLAWCLYVARDFQGASEQCWKTLALDPQFAAAQHILGLAYEQMGMIEEATVELRNARTCSRDHPAMLAAFAHACADRAALQELEQLSGQRYVSPYWYGIVYAGLGNRDSALDALDQARRERDVWLTWLQVEPRFHILRAEPRFQELLGSIGLGL